MFCGKSNESKPLTPKQRNLLEQREHLLSLRLLTLIVKANSTNVPTSFCISDLQQQPKLANDSGKILMDNIRITTASAQTVDIV